MEGATGDGDTGVLAARARAAVAAAERGIETCSRHPLAVTSLQALLPCLRELAEYLTDAADHR